MLESRPIKSRDAREKPSRKKCTKSGLSLNEDLRYEILASKRRFASLEAVDGEGERSESKKRVDTFPLES